MNNTQRVLTALLLTASMLLSGCVGDPSRDGDSNGIIPSAQASSTTVVNGNYLPMVHGEVLGPLSENISYVFNTTNGNGYYDATLEGLNVSLYHSVIDPEGTAMVMGWDLNLDGQIDNLVSANQGITTVYLPLNSWEAVPQSTEDAHMKSVAFIATDIDGGMGVSMVHIQHNFPLDRWRSYVGSGLFDFSASDAGASVSTGTDDALVMIAMDQGSDINWAAVSVKLTIDGNAPVTCDNNDQGTSTCYLVEYGTTDDQVWSVGDGVTVYESGQDLCNNSCEIVITITDINAGKKIDESTTVAE